MAQFHFDPDTYLGMIRAEMGCIADGSGSFSSCIVNGGGKGSGGH